MKPINERKHHYVPQFLLRSFAQSDKEMLHAFDKTTSRIFKIAVKDAAAEKGFNSCTSSDETICIEDFYTSVEELASPILKRILDGRKLPVLSAREIVIVSRFLAAQMIRTKARREIGSQISIHMRMMAEQEGSPEFKRWIGQYDPKQEKLFHLKGTESLVHELSHALIHKDIMLFERVSGSPLLIGDNPLVTTNTFNRCEFRGTTGLASKQVEVYLPLSPTLVLGFLCPTIADQFRRACILFGRNVHNVVIDYLIALETKKNVRFEDANVTFVNSLQIRDAERFVYSSDGDFTLAAEMMLNNPELRRGPRFTIVDRGKEIEQDVLEEWSRKEGKGSRG